MIKIVLVHLKETLNNRFILMIPEYAYIGFLKITTKVKANS